MVKYGFNVFTGNFDQILNLDSPMQFKGEINSASDFPTSSEVKNGWFYTIGTDVTDNDPSKTNTGQSFEQYDEIAWNGTDWTIVGINGDDNYLKLDGSNANTNINIGSYNFTTTGNVNTTNLTVLVLTNIQQIPRLVIAVKGIGSAAKRQKIQITGMTARIM